MTFANKITLSRIISIPFFIACLLFFTPEKSNLKYIALAIFLLAVVSDIIDGYIARTKRQRTRAGAILDPLADKALLISAFIFTYQVSRDYFSIVLPLWVVLIVVSRDIMLLIGSGIILSINKDAQIKPTRWGKITTFFQMLTIITVLLELNISIILWWTASIFTVISGIDYVRRGINTINSLDHGRNNNKACSGNLA